MQIGCKLTLVIPITDQCELTVQLQLTDLVLQKVVGPQLLRNQILLWSLEGWQVDEKRDAASWLVLLPELVFQVSIECRLARTRVAKNKHDLAVAGKKVPDLIHKREQIVIRVL